MKYSTDLGPLFYANWKASLQETFTGGYEYALYTDARLTGMITEGYGPYQFPNTISGSITEEPMLTANLVLRLNGHLEYERREDTSTNEKHYHGGGLADEAAALLSLCMGIRFKAGGITREFSAEHLQGIPCGWDYRPTPTLEYHRFRSLLVPSAVGQHSLDDVSPMQSLPLLSPVDVGVLIQAARLYQHGMWICESEPALSWLLLVSAVEAAANHWRAGTETPVERLKASRPKLEPMLTEVGGPDLVEKVAIEITPYMGATKKFLDFMFAFLPDAPQKRPYDWAQHSWDNKSWKKTFAKVYEYRSRALHAGQPFPAPMCFPPLRLEEDIGAEKPLGGGTGNHQWSAEDVPLHLHTFEYLVRNVLLNWWASLISDDS